MTTFNIFNNLGSFSFQWELLYSFLETISVIIRLNSSYCFPIVDPTEKVPAASIRYERVSIIDHLLVIPHLFYCPSKPAGRATPMTNWILCKRLSNLTACQMAFYQLICTGCTGYIKELKKHNRHMMLHTIAHDDADAWIMWLVN